MIPPAKKELFSGDSNADLIVLAQDGHARAPQNAGELDLMFSKEFGESSLEKRENIAARPISLVFAFLPRYFASRAVLLERPEPRRLRF
jgi:hypothetical protein